MRDWGGRGTAIRGGTRQLGSEAVIIKRDAAIGEARRGVLRDWPKQPRMPKLRPRISLARIQSFIGVFPFLRDRDAKRREAHASPWGLRAPATPVPPFFGSPKKGGKESSPLAMSPGLLPATRYARPAQMPAHGRRGSRTHRPTPKSPASRRHPPGAKKRHTGHPHKKRPP